MKIIVTGATGFIGTHVVKALALNQYQVIPLSRNRDFNEMIIFFQNEKPDLVIHLASLFVAEHKTEQVNDLIKGNVLFGAQLLEAMHLSGVKKLLNVGSSWQNFGLLGDEPVCLYAATKNAFQELAKFYQSAHNFSVITLKIFDTYGANDERAKLIPNLIQRLNSDNYLDLSPGEQLLNIVHVSDVVNAFILTVKEIMSDSKTFKMEEYFVRSKELISLKDLIQLIETESGKKLPVRLGARAYRAREVMHPWAGGKTVPGWQATRSLSEGLKEILNV